MFMRTDRLFLRPVFAEDWRDIFRGIADYRIVRHLARVPWPYGETHARDFCDRATARDSCFAITVPEVPGAPVIGVISTHTPGCTTSELGYWIAHDWHGRGIATEAVRGVLEIVQALGMGRIEAGHYLDNPASGRVLVKAGFMATGELRETACLARGSTLPARRYSYDLQGDAKKAA